MPSRRAGGSSPEVEPDYGSNLSNPVVLPTKDSDLRTAYERMLRHFGHQGWWPGESPFEVCLGAILTQNTNWTNVERALGNIRRESALDPRILWRLPESELARLLRPSGYFRVKAGRVRSFLEVLVTRFEGSVERLLSGPLATVRRRLLAIPGIGPETADSMLLYAGRRPVFVVDAYTRRIFSRHGWCASDVSYEALRESCEGRFHHGAVARRVDMWQDCHAQLVAVGKHYCRPNRPRCHECPLQPMLPGLSPIHPSNA